jgi:nuclear cap-binding protein subunit 1
MIMDKFLNYRIIDPITVVQWAFDDVHANRFDWSYIWNVLRRTLVKVIQRANTTFNKLTQAREEFSANESRRLLDGR